MTYNVYKNIEDEIKKTDFYTRESLLIDILYFAIIICICSTFWLFMFDTTIGWVVVAIIFVLFIIIWYIINFKIVYEISHSIINKDLQPFKEINRSCFLKVKTVFALMKKLKKTKPPILDIIRENGITTKDGLEEAISHYRFKATSTRQLRIDIFAILALSISVMGYFLNNLNLPRNIFLMTSAIILTFVFIIYILLIIICKKMFAQYGEKAFYTRIENALSEIRALNKLSTRGRKPKNIFEEKC